MNRIRTHRLVSKRFIKASPIIAIAAIASLASISSYAFVRLANSGGGLYWAQGTTAPVIYTISSNPAPGITDGSDAAAIRVGFMQWETVPSTSIRFSEDQNAQDRANTNWHQPGLNLCFFDTDGSSGMFTSASGLVAVTPVQFAGDGSIVQATMIFNAKDHSFTTTDEPNKFDVQSIATHEAGHFIGLDHSPVVGATMDPFAFPQDTRLRSLERDDVAGCSTIYPRPGYALGSISGRIVRASDGSGISGAHVVAESIDGTPASSNLTAGDGTFVISGLASGVYHVYAEPMDGPVRGSNLSLATSGLQVKTDFATTFLGTPTSPTNVNVGAGVDTSIATITCPASTGITLTSANPSTVLAGDHVTVTVYGNNVKSGDSFSVSGDGMTVTGVTTFSGGAQFTLDVAAGAPASLRSIHLVGSGAARVLTGGIEIRNPAPVITGISPTTGTPGTAINVAGSNFTAGGLVIMGGTVILGPSASSGSVSFNCPSLAAGTYDICVENPDGQSAKVLGAFTVNNPTAAPPTAGTPTSGQTAPTNSPSPSSTPQTSAQNPSIVPQNGATVPGADPSNGVAVAPISGGGGGGGGGGCALGPVGASPAALAPFAMLALGLVLARRRRFAI